MIINPTLHLEEFKRLISTTIDGGKADRTDYSGVIIDGGKADRTDYSGVIIDGGKTQE